MELLQIMAGSRGLFAEGAAKLNRKSAGDDEIDITPMIDCVFLLLIFFMVSSTMQGGVDLDVPVANHSVGIDAHGAAVVTIRNPENPGAIPRIILGDGGGQEAQVAEIKPYVEDAVRSGRTKIVLKAEGEVTHGTVDEVARAIKSVIGAELYMGVRERNE